MMPSAFGAGPDKGKEYVKYVVLILIAAFMLWFGIQGLQVVGNFMN
jgi:hypothetical protein